MLPIILVVDDDAGLLAAVERDVRGRYGDAYRVLQAVSGEAALAVCQGLREDGQRVALLVAGGDLPLVRDAHFLSRARDVYPDAARVLLTDGTDVDAAIVHSDRRGLSRYLPTPWDPPEERLFAVLDELLADWRLRADLPYRRVRDVMDTDVVRVDPNASVHEAAAIVARSSVGDLMVVGDDGRFHGVLSEGDILRRALPDIDAILAAGGTLFDAYQLFLRTSRDLHDDVITALVIREPLVAHPDDHVAKVAVALLDHQIRRLPVIEEARLVGTVSRTNICRAVVGGG